jgi:hypothetical protein
VLAGLRALVVATLVALGCGGPVARSEPVAVGPAATPTAPQAVVETKPRGASSLVDQVLADLRAIADELCGCPDVACVEQATGKLDGLSKKYGNAALGDVPQEASDEVDRIVDRMASCAGRITAGRRPRPKLPGQP